MLGIKICPVCHEIFDQKEGQENLTCGHPQCVKEAQEILDNYIDLEEHVKEIRRKVKEHNQLLKRLKNKLRIVSEQFLATHAHIRDIKEEIEAAKEIL